MTPDQIRQIAEEYAYAHNSNPNPPYCHEEELTKRLTEAFIAGAQYITERYCVVEKSKVVKHYQLALEDSEEMGEESDEKVLLELLFGSETFNKKEDD